MSVCVYVCVYMCGGKAQCTLGLGGGGGLCAYAMSVFITMVQQKLQNSF